MGFGQTLILGLIAGSTIVLGLPVGRMRNMSANVRLLLNSLAVGILVFLLWDILSQAWEPIDHALAGIHDASTTWAEVLGYGALFVAGLGLGLFSLVWYEGWLSKRKTKGAALPAGPGTMVAHELTKPALSPARRLAVFIALGIGLHNFAEGLAIGQSSASGEIALATLLVIGFALHNATEGFGIVAPLAGETDAAGQKLVPSWGFLLLLGLIGGGPTFVGTILGYSIVNTAVSVIFLSLAAGSILYVIVQLIIVGGRSARRDLLAYGIFAGMLAGFVTDGILVVAGA